MSAERGAASEAALRWLELGRDVLVHGDAGADRGRQLRRIAGEAQRAGFLVGRLGDDGAPELLRVGRPGGRGEPDKADGSARGRWVTFVEDIDEGGEAAADRVSRFVRRTGGCFVASTTLDLLLWSDDGLARFIASRAPAVVPIPPLSYSGMLGLAQTHLSGPVSGPVVSSLLAWSGGIPGVATALLDTARFNGALQRDATEWVLRGEFCARPLDAVAFLLCGRMTHAEIAALETLAGMGPSAPDTVLTVVPAPVLDRLISQGRVTVLSGRHGPRMAVSPPALAVALRDRTGSQGPVGPDVPSVVEVAEDADVGPALRTLRLLLSADAEALEAFRSWASAQIGVVHQRDVLREAAASSAWERTHTLVDAVAYLTLLMQRPVTGRVREVFEQTTIAHGADRRLIGAYHLLLDRWHSWLGVGPAELVLPEPPTCPVAAVADVAERILEVEPGPDGEALLAASLPFAAHYVEPARSMALMREAATLLEAGRLDLALRLSDPALRPDWASSGDVMIYLDGIHDLALLYAGRPREGLDASLRHLARALTEGDALGIRVHGAGAGQALAMTGHEEAAGTLLYSVLKLGPAGPLGGSFYAHLLLLASMRVCCNESAEARHTVGSELQQIPVASSSLTPLPALAEAERLRGRGLHREADELLWAQGLDRRDEGRFLWALRLWVQRSGVPTPEELTTIRATASAMPGSVMDTLVRIWEAILAEDADGLPELLRAAPLAMTPLLAEAALNFLDDARATARRRPLTPAERTALIGEPLARRLAGERRQSSLLLLSVREREVARLAGAGHSNREIAQMLVLSPRTVENHVHHVLTKLGLETRESFAALAL